MSYKSKEKYHQEFCKALRIQRFNPISPEVPPACMASWKKGYDEALAYMLLLYETK